MTAQDLQDKYGYVIVGLKVRHKAPVLGEILDGFQNRQTDERIVTPLRIIGFATTEEWKQQVEDSGYQFNPSWARLYRYMVKVIAE